MAGSVRGDKRGCYGRGRGNGLALGYVVGRGGRGGCGVAIAGIALLAVLGIVYLVLTIVRAFFLLFVMASKARKPSKPAVKTPPYPGMVWINNGHRVGWVCKK